MNLPPIKENFALVIFGASGDLAKLKIFPALYALAEQKLLPKNFHIIGFSRTPKTQKQFQKEFSSAIKQHSKTKPQSKILKNLTEKVDYFTGQYHQEQDYQALRQHIQKLKIQTTLAYFSVPPTVFQDIIKNLGTTKSKQKEELRLIIEKPFGQDQKSAEELFRFVIRYFDEESVYLMDHYLGKLAVQNLLHLRHQNRILNHMVKGPRIRSIQITASETTGVKERAGYFEQVGIIKDMFQSHLLQILALITMSIPITEDPESLKQEKENILTALNFKNSKRNISLGQYKSYQQEKNVKKNSQTETFAALRLMINRETWYKVPIYIRTGKKLQSKKTYIVIELKKFAFQDQDEQPNRLVIELQPQEKISLHLVTGENKTPQVLTTTAPENCSGKSCLTEYGSLLYDALQKDKKYFLSFQEILATWRITDQVTNYVKNNKLKPQKYQDNLRGPASQDSLTDQDKITWYEL